MKLNEAMKIVPPSPRSEKLFRRNYYEAKIGKASGKGGTADEAVDNLKSTIKSAFEGSYPTCVYSFRGVVMVGWRTQHDWRYQILNEDHNEHEIAVLYGCSVGYESEEEMRTDMRTHIASITWDGEEERSPILRTEEEQERFRRDALWQKRFRELKATGMEDAAIRWQINQERI